MVETIPAILRAAAERYGDKAAYVDGDRVLTFDELLGFVQAAARGYVELGVNPGDRVVLSLDRPEVREGARVVATELAK